MSLASTPAALAQPYALQLPATLATPRLKLRPFVIEDASRLAMFVGDYDVAKMTASIPHPYSETDARAFIAKPGEAHIYAIVHANGMIGAVGLRRVKSERFEFGYWLAKPFWGRGFMTEAARAVIVASRQSCPTASLTSGHFADNPASGRVLDKIGFMRTGEKPGHSVARNATVRLITFALPPT